MIAERPPGSEFIRVYDDGGGYSQGSPIRFVVGIKTRRDMPGWAFLEAGMGMPGMCKRFYGEIWRALDLLLGKEGFTNAEWEVMDLMGDTPTPRTVCRRVRSLTNPLPAESVSC